MRNKLFYLCLLAALFLPFLGHCQEETTREEYREVDSWADSWAKRKIALEYYKDYSHWDVFIEPSIIEEEETSFDKSGLRHGYFVQRFYCFAIPQESNLNYQPKKMGPYLFAYGQKLPVEGKDPNYFQMIRSAVFPFAANFSANVSSNSLFKKYADQRLNDDIIQIVDSLLFRLVDNLDVWDFVDIRMTTNNKTYPHFSVISCLENELSEVMHEKKAETIFSQKNIDQLKKGAIRNKGNIYLFPVKSILREYATELTYSFLYEGFIDAPILPFIKKSTQQSIYEEGWGSRIMPKYVAGKNYLMLNSNTILLHNERCNNYLDPIEKEQGIILGHSRDTVLYVSPKGIRKESPGDCYRACLKGTNVSCLHTFPPLINVRVSNDSLWSYYKDCKDCYTKDRILQYLKDGSVLYDFFAKDYYKDYAGEKYRGIKYDTYDADYYSDYDIYYNADYQYYYANTESSEVEFPPTEEIMTEEVEEIQMVDPQSQDINILLRNSMEMYNKMYQIVDELKRNPNDKDLMRKLDDIQKSLDELTNQHAHLKKAVDKMGKESIRK